MTIIRTMTSADASAVLGIYSEGLATGHASFAAEAPDWAAWDADHLAAPRLVAMHGDAPAGFTALSPTSTRPVYRGVAEVSLYVAATARGQGAGKALLGALTEQSERAGIWTLQAGIFPENTASIALHEAAGFRLLGVRERVGRMSHGPRKGHWRDVMLFERRSLVAGVD